MAAAEQNVLFIDIERCLGCKACEIACAVEHSQTKELFTAIFEKPRPMPRVRAIAAAGYVVPLQCRHCEKAACVEVCPTEALKRTPEGIVILDEALCTGCKACIIACPFAAVLMDWYKRVVSKCDLCIDRIRRGLKPACVEACPTGALMYGRLEDLTREVQARKAQEAITGRGVAPKGLVLLRGASSPSEEGGE